MKKRSAAKLNEKQRDVLTLLLDETLAGKSIVEGLSRHGISSLPLEEVVPRGTSDSELLTALAARPDLHLLTRDKDFRYHSSIKVILSKASVGVFVITSAGNKKASELVAIVQLAWTRMQRFVRKNKKPFVAKVSTAGHVEKHL